MNRKQLYGSGNSGKTFAGITHRVGSIQGTSRRFVSLWIIKQPVLLSRQTGATQTSKSAGNVITQYIVLYDSVNVACITLREVSPGLGSFEVVK